MRVVQVFDPALCCSSGVCGVDVDEALVRFSADIDWARQNGTQIERFNLAQQPLAFAENATAKAFLEQSGQDALPLVLVDGQRVLSGRYPTREELSTWLTDAEAPSLFTAQVAELVVISAAIAANCEPCFKYHSDLARKLGVSNADMRRAVDLAQKVKDTPARTMLDLAARYIDRDGTAASNEHNAQPVAASSCCSPATANPTKTGCC